MTRFDLDMDGSMEPSEYGHWVRYEDAQRQALRADTWGGLTQQDIDIAFDDTREGGGFDDFARAIEAVLKEKNT